MDSEDTEEWGKFLKEAGIMATFRPTIAQAFLAKCISVKILADKCKGSDSDQAAANRYVTTALATVYVTDLHGNPVNLDQEAIDMMREVIITKAKILNDKAENSTINPHDISLIANQISKKLKLGASIAEIDSIGYRTYEQVFTSSISSNAYTKQSDVFLNSVGKKKPSKETITALREWSFTYPVQAKDVKKNENEQQHPEFLRILMQNPAIQKKTYSNSFYLQCPNGVIVNQPYTPTLRGKKPDMVLYDDYHNRNEINIRCVIELTMYDDLEKDESHLGKMIEYNHLILDTQPTRSKVISVLTNVAQMVFVMSAQNSTGKSGHVSRVMASTDGIYYLLGLLAGPKDYTGFQTPALTFKRQKLVLQSYLGCGTTSCCYLANGGNVIKCFHAKADYTKELEFYEELNKSVGGQQREHIAKFIGNNDKSMFLVFEGQGVKIDEQYRTANFVRELFKCLRELERLKIIHRDITLRHFLWRKEDQKKLMIVDFGCSLLTPTKVSSYSGTAYLAANEVLQAQIDSEPYVPAHRHDWESAVKLMIIVFGFANYSELANQIEKQRAAGEADREHLNVTDRFKIILNYWQTKEIELQRNDCFLFDLLVITRSDRATLDQLENKLKDSGFFRCYN